MSILIKNMKMPNNCIGCAMLVGTFCQVLNIDVDPFYDGSVKRNDNCPLVELQSNHGRLIDEDEIEIPSLETVNDQYLVFDAIKDAQTIIEAEEKEECDDN